MALRETCWKCGRPDWAGRQEVTPPSGLYDGGMWSRRTWCLYCSAAQDEVANGGLMALTSRHEPTVYGGTNPFVEASNGG